VPFWHNLQAYVSDTALLPHALEIWVSLQKITVTTTFVQNWLSFVKIDLKIVLTVLIGDKFFQKQL
jgi:hypothetical protein